MMPTKIEELIGEPSLKITPKDPPVLTSKFQLMGLTSRLFLQIWRTMMRVSGSWFKVIQVARELNRKYKIIYGEPFVSKAVKVDGRYFWRLGSPGFPSKASVRMTENEINRVLPFKSKKGLKIVLMAITKKCPLNCEHCFEWENLHQEEKLTRDDIIKIIHKYQEYGTTTFMLTGGEPMLRINDIYKVLETAKEGSDFWIVTSGLGLNEKRAKQFKSFGLTGVIISLDHYLAAEHNRFRGFDKAYENAVSAVINANNAGLVTSFSLCVTKEFINRENLTKYMDFAKKLGVSFVQFLDPKPLGKYKDKSVELEDTDFQLLDEFYHEYNTSRKYWNYPIIDYNGYHGRRVGCFSGGNRVFYIDTDGDAHVCPFCSKKVCNTKMFSAEDTIALLNQCGCHSFQKNENF